MRAILVLLIFVITPFIGNAYSQDFNYTISGQVSSKEKITLQEIMKEVSELLPAKLKSQLPDNLQINVAMISAHKNIPNEVCASGKEDKLQEKKVTGKKEKSFVYGYYEQTTNTLTLHSAVLNELSKGRAGSTRINCQHKSLYNQALATIVHEITHAYDFHNQRISNSMEFIRRAGFKKGLLKVKSKNIEAMRSADPYELINIAEAFAVNMEYFTMDPEFMCRKPSMFEFYKKHFGFDPFPDRKCSANTTVMMSTMQGFIPVALDSRRVYRIDYLLASAGKGISSGFGHSMFRIVMCAPERQDLVSGKTIVATPFGKKCLDDKLYHLVVSFRANVEDATLNYLKGLTGGYPSMLFILNLGDVLDEYNRDELRDVMAYPMALSSKEKDEFVTRVIEEHWNYRGSYKFVNNNCAVESYDLLKTAIDRASLDENTSITPNGVLADLDRLQFTSSKHTEVETYKAKTDQLILAYLTAYGAKLSQSEKTRKNAVLKFMEESKATTRMTIFDKFQKSKIQNVSLNEEVVVLKERMVKASSFSVMEQQILRTLALKFRKKAADMFMNTNDERIKKMIAETGAAFSQSFTDLSKSGYGIPFNEEMVSKDDLDKKVVNSAEALVKADGYLRELMPVEYEVLESIAANIKVYNNYSLQVRKDFRGKLDSYVFQVLKNMAINEETRELLNSASQGNSASLKMVRNYLGAELVSEKEILDARLRKVISDIL